MADLSQSTYFQVQVTQVLLFYEIKVQVYLTECFPFVWSDIGVYTQ